MAGETDYNKNVYGATTEIVSNPIQCANASVSSSHSATLIFKELRCDNNAAISVDHSATLVIDRLVCNEGSVDVSYASTLHIKELICRGKFTINDSYSSTVRIDGGEIALAQGVIKFSSLGVCHAAIHRDEVTAETSSTWST